MKQLFFLKTWMLAIALFVGTNGASAQEYQNLPIKGSATLDLTKYAELGTGAAWDATNSRINITSKGAYVDYYVTVSDADYYSVEAFVDWCTNADDKFKVTITDVTTSTVEAEQEFGVKTGNNTKQCPITAGKVTAGNKKVRFTFNVASNRCNFKNVSFYTFVNNSWPTVASSTVFDLSLATCTNNGTRYESGNQNIGSVKNGSIVELYAINEAEAYYYMQMGVSRYGEGAFNYMVTDVATSTIEVNQNFDVPSVSNYTNSIFPLTTKITTGLKKITYTFSGTGNSSGYILNFKNVTFGINNMLDESEGYTPVDASDAVVTLKRSIKANKWSTIVLPFAMTNAQLTNAFGDDVKVVELTNSSTATNLAFNTVAAIEANKPYAIKVTTDFASATIDGVNLVSATPTQSVGDWNFVGTYTASTIPTASFYFKSNALYKAGDTGTHSIKPFRAYFTYVGSGDAPNSLDYDIDADPTAIAGLSEESSAPKNGAIYNMAGQRIGGLMKGVNIVNGMKVIK